jgi:hypothetical protein
MIERECMMVYSPNVRNNIHTKAGETMKKLCARGAGIDWGGRDGVRLFPGFEGIVF